MARSDSDLGQDRCTFHFRLNRFPEIEKWGQPNVSSAASDVSVSRAGVSITEQVRLAIVAALYLLLPAKRELAQERRAALPRPNEVCKGDRFAGPRVLHLIAGAGTAAITDDEVIDTGNPRRLEGHRTDPGGGIEHLDDEPFAERVFVPVGIVQPGSG